MPLPRPDAPLASQRAQQLAAAPEPGVPLAGAPAASAAAWSDADRSSGPSAIQNSAVQALSALTSAKGLLTSSSSTSQRLRQKFRAATSAVGTVAYPIASLSARTVHSTMAWVAQGATAAAQGKPGTSTVGAGFSALLDSVTAATSPSTTVSSMSPTAEVIEEIDILSTTSTVPLPTTLDLPAGSPGAPLDLLDPVSLSHLRLKDSDSSLFVPDMGNDRLLPGDDGDNGAIAKKAESEENLKRSTSLALTLPVVPMMGTKPVLALDLDETLIHSSLVPRRAPDFTIDVVQGGDARTRETFYVYKRPYVDAFLAEVAKHYTVLVFTAGIREYASQILDRLDPTGTLIQARLFRDSCTEVRSGGTTFAKDLGKVCVDMRKVLLVDNTPGCFAIQPANGVLIKSWYTDLTDRQLVRLADWLVAAKDADDMRMAIREWNPQC